MNQMRGSDDQKLDALFEVYREACSAPDVSPNFMPNLWARIESRQRFTFSFRRLANAWATAAVSLSLALCLYMYMPRSARSDYSQTYVEALAENNSADATEVVNPVTVELSADSPTR